MANRNAVIRISKYKNALNRFRALGLERIFSDNLADAVGVSSAQVRKDFSQFGITGFKKGGYRVESLIDRLNKLLGKHEIVPIVVVGFGKIGQALVGYPNFEPEGLKVSAVFDIDPAKFNPRAATPVLPLEAMKEYIRANGIRVGVVAVPDSAAQQATDLLVAAGIRGVLNFAPIRLRTPDNVVVSHVNFVLELENLIYYVNTLE